MPHEIDHSTGAPAIAYVGDKPWHGLGARLQAGAPIDVWLKAARLDWELQRLPVQYLVEGELRTMDNKYVLARNDTHAALSVVSGSYCVVQPKAVLEFYRSLVEENGYVLETAGALNEGRRVWALASTGNEAKIGNEGEDKIAAYVLLATSCDKSLATTAAFTSIRVVCQNTLFFAQQDIAQNRRPQVKVDHGRKFDQERVKEELGIKRNLETSWAAFLDQVRRMTELPVEPDAVAGFFHDVLLKKGEKHLSNTASRELETLRSVFTSAPGQQLKTARNTLWGAVNAVTYYVDNVRSSSAGDRLDSSWFGSGQLLKEKAWNLARSWIN